MAHGAGIITPNPRINKYFWLSDELQASSDAELTEGGQALVKKKTIHIGAQVVKLRIKFDIYASNPAFNAEGQIYKNGGQVGILRVNGTSDYVTYSQDLAFAAGDTCELWCRSDQAGVVCYLRNFRIYATDRSPFAVTTP